MKDQFDFFLTTIPPSRPADYYLGCLGGSVFLDFNESTDNRICLKRIFFDKYGWFELDNQVIPMDEKDSQKFREIMRGKIYDVFLFGTIIKNTISNNRNLIREDALSEYGFI
jgi:hypothetical protein